MEFRSTLAWFFVLMTGAVLPPACLCAAEDVVSRPIFRSVESSYQCGLYSFYAAAQSMGYLLEINQVLKSRYMSALNGSTPRDLLRLAKDHMIPATARRSVRFEALCQSHDPVLLLLGHSNRRTKHWVTWLGQQNGRHVIYDCTRGIAEISATELKCLWNGKCVFLGETAESVGITARSRLAELVWIWPPFVLLLSVCFASSRSNAFRLFFKSISGQLLTVFAFVACWWGGTSLGSGSLIRNTEIANVLACQFEPGSREKLEAVNFVKSVDEKDATTIVDARLPMAFNYSSIPGSINVPVDLNFFELKELLGTLDRHRNYVVYCQNSQCPWASQIAIKLQCLGFKASVLSGGFDEWRNNRQERKR